MSLAIGFDMKPNQAATLLENSNKYLTIMCVRGAKSADFESVLRWYGTLFPVVGTLVHLINTEKKDVLAYSKASNAAANRGKNLFKTLNILKNGFYSRNNEVQLACGMLFNNLIREINQTGGDIVGDAWDWFTSSTLVPEFNRQKIGSHLIKGRSPVKGATDKLLD